MRARALEHLVCPLDGGPLEMSEWEAETKPLQPDSQERALRLGIDPATLERDILTGVLVNPRLHLLYPVVGGVPRMLTFPTAIGAAFSERHSDRLRGEFSGFSLPHDAPMPGEAGVLRSFSTEWTDYDWDGKAYWGLSPSHMYRVMDFMLDLREHPLAGKTVLEVGIGVGGIANHVASTQDCELLGLDLSYAVEPAYRHFGSSNPFLHVVQGSAFQPPFAEQSFDFVFSQGVLHHTFSTRVAIESVARLPKVGGRLYVWVYSPWDERRTIVRRMLYGLELIIRPVCSRLPSVLQSIILAPLTPLYIVHQNFLLRGERASYGWREAMHAARDRFTPPFVHRHSDEEVCEWYRNLGYGQLRCVSERDRPDYVPIPFVACAGVEGVRGIATPS